MARGSRKHNNRRSIRLPGYDYSSRGTYSVSICTRKQLCLFGKVVDGEMQLNDPGKTVDRIWREIPEHYPGVDVDTHTVMPNHLHGIIMLSHDNISHGQTRSKGQAQGPARTSLQTRSKGQAQGPAPTYSLGDVIKSFKSLTTREYIRGVKTHKWKPFARKLWQRNYYEHIIRNEDELARTREYITSMTFPRLLSHF